METSELQPNDVLTYTLQVITEVMGSTVTIGRICDIVC